MNNKLTQFLRKDLQEKLQSGVVNSLRVQLESLNHFARQLGYEPVGGSGNFKNGFRKYNGQERKHAFVSLEQMQFMHNNGAWSFRRSASRIKNFEEFKIVERIAIQYNKRTTKELTSELHCLKFIKEE